MVTLFLQQHLSGWKPYLWLFLLQLVLHGSHLGKPASGNHVWRQCNTLSVAKNFADESMDIRYPRIDKRYGSDGVCGPSFVSYEYGLAALYKVFGFHETLFRYWSFGLCLAVVWGWFCFLLHRFPREYSFFGAASLFGFPEFYFHSIGAIPDLLALAAAIWGLVLFDAKRPAWATLMLTLAAATKLYFGLAWVFVWVSQWQRGKDRMTSSLWAVGSVALALSWYAWAAHLNALNGLWEFLNETRLADSGIQALQLLWRNAFVQSPLWWMGPLMFVSVAAGIWFGAKGAKVPIIATVMAACVLYIALQKQFEHHGYYTLVFVPLWSAIAVFAWKRLSLTPLQLMALVSLSIAWSLSQMERNYYGEKRRVPSVLLDPQSRAKCEELSAMRRVWLVGPDPTGCVFFYYTGAKGYPWYSPNESRDLLGPFGRAQSGVFAKPVEGIVTNQPKEAYQLARDLGWSLDSLGSVGEFVWFGLRPQ